MSPQVFYAALDRDAKAEALTLAANATGKAPRVLEKDFWVCWCLHRLFTASGLPALVFKGGTSLSKVFGAIDRFSEDVDITVSGSELGYQDHGLSNAARDRAREEVEARLLELARGKLRAILEEPGVQIDVDKDATIWVQYDSAVADPGNRYLLDSVKVELGARNPIIPSESHVVAPDLANALPQLLFPRVTVEVLSPVRTFWEKATILHAEYHREDGKRPTAERIARHYYDLSRLADHEIGARALKEMSMLERVAADKIRLFRSSWAKYELARPGTLRLAPPAERTAPLAEDLSKMIDSGMFAGEPPSWTSIVERLAVLEDTINSSSLAE